MLCAIKREINTVAMTIPVRVAKLEQLCDTLSEWSSGRAFTPERELRSLVGRFLHLCEVVPPGQYFVRRMLMLNQVGLAPVRARSEEFRVPHARLASSSRNRSGPELRADVSFRRLLVEGGLGSVAGRLSAPLCRSFMQPPAFTLWSDASGDAMGGYFLGTVPGADVWWRVEYKAGIRARLREKVSGWNDLSINVLELLGMAVTAWIFVTQSHILARYARDTIPMRGDNTSAVHWVSKRREGREPRSGAFMRILGHLEVGSKGCLDVLRVAGVETIIADGISRWEPEAIDGSLRASRPDVAWRRQVLGPAGVALCSGVLAASSSASRGHRRLTELIRQVSGLGPLFGG